MIWFVLWAVLLVGGLAVLGAIALTLYRKARRLLHDLAQATELLEAASAQAQRLGRGDETAPAPAVFSQPGQLRAERIRAQRLARRSARV